MAQYHRDHQAYEHNYAQYVVQFEAHRALLRVWQEWRRREDARQVARRGADQRPLRGFERDVVFQYHLTNVFFEVQPDAICKPVDYNWMYRCFSLYPTPEETPSQFETLCSIGIMDVFLCSAMLAETLRAASTTVFQSCNITGQQLHEYSTMGGLAGEFQGFISRGYFEPCLANSDGHALFYDFVHDLVLRMTSHRVSNVMMFRRKWNSGPTTQGEYEMMSIYNTAWPDTIPRFNSVLCIDNWLQLRPLEWAISIPNPIVDITKDIVRDQNGNFSFMAFVGDSTYTAPGGVGMSYCKFVVYGVAVANVINQAFYEHQPAPPLVEYSMYSNDHGAMRQWVDAPIQDYPQVIWNNDLGIIELCTMLSYDWRRRRTLAPRIAGTPLNRNIMMDISNRAIGSLQNTGVYLFTRGAAVPLYNVNGSHIFDSFGPV